MTGTQGELDIFVKGVLRQNLETFSDSLYLPKPFT